MTAVLALGLTLSGCAKTSESGTSAASSAASAMSSVASSAGSAASSAGSAASSVASSAGSAASSAASSASGAASADLQSLLPAPEGATTKGPDSIADNGIHLHYEVKGAPAEVMDAYKKTLEAKGWDVTTVVTSGNEGGGGATYSGTNGAAYGVFDGGGPSSMTFIDVCTWPTKPANPNCNRGER